MVYPALNQGQNQVVADPVGLTFLAEAGTNYLFELYPIDPYIESGLYKLTLQRLDDYGASCSGAALLNLGVYNQAINGLENLISSQLPTGDQDCFHLQPPRAGSYMLALTPPENSLASGRNLPLIELFSYDPHAFGFANETRTPLLQFTNTSGIAANGDYTLWFINPPGPPTGLTYAFPAFNQSVGYCACISAGTPSGDNGQQGDTGTSGTGGSQVGWQEEHEPNNSYDSRELNNWDINTPMHGKLDINLDADIYDFTAPQSGIFLITLGDVPYNIEPDLSVFRSQNSSLVVKALNAGVGNTTSVEFDANQGDIFYIKVKASSEFEVSDHYYSLTAKFIKDLDEPNDTSAQATPWNDITQSMQGFFYELLTGPADVYKFSVPQSLGSVLLTVQLTGVDGVQADMYIKNQWGGTIVSNTSSAAGANVILITDANPGEVFYVWVNPRTSSQVSEKQYTLQISTTPDLGEPNDSVAQATGLNITGGPIKGYFFEIASGTGDYYKFTAPAGQAPISMTARLYNVDPNITPQMYIKTSSNSTVASKENAGPGEEITLTFNVQPGGTYYVLVKPASTATFSTIQYFLSVAASPK